MSDARVLDAGPISSTPGPGLRMAGRRIEIDDHNCFACGSLNTHGLGLELHSDRGRCWTQLSLARRFEGWDQIAHGGIVATILDEVMAWALIDHDSWGLTARMTVTFKRPVPIERPIRGEGWVVEVSRRLMRTAGSIVDATTGELLATAEAVYVPAPDERKQALKARYGYRLIDDQPDTVDRP